MRVAVLTLAACLLAAPDAAAQRLPLRQYGVADGLPHLSVHVLFQDSRGYLWVGTVDGIARFDGSSFVTYGVDDGLQSAAINNFFEDSEGRIWVATNGGGISRLGAPGPESSEPSGRPFESFSVGAEPFSNRVNAVAVDDQHTVWAMTDAGLYKGDARAGAVTFTAVRSGSMVDWSHAVAAEGGRLWLALQKHVLEVSRGRVIDRGPAMTGVVDRTGVTSMTRAAPAGIYAATVDRVLRYRPHDDPRGPAPEVIRPPIEPGEWITAIASSGDTLWIGTSGGLLRWRDGSVRRFGRREGISTVLALTFDREGHLWIGSDAGLQMLVTDGAAAYSLANDVSESEGLRIVEDREKRIFASGWNGIARLDRGEVEWLPGSSQAAFGRISSRFTQDQAGGWWVGTDDRLWWMRGPGLDFTRAVRVDARHGFPAEAQVLRVEPGDDGGAWISVGTPDRLYECRARGGRPACEAVLNDAQAVLRVSSRVDDGVWVARYGDLAFLRDGVLRAAAVQPGLPELNARALLIDRRGRMWIGLRGHGLSVCRDAAAALRDCRNFSRQDGLSGGFVRDLAEAADGTIYAATDRGVDVINPETGAISHLAAEFGFDGGPVRDLLVDSSGRLWAAQVSGVLQVSTPNRPLLQAPEGPHLLRFSVRGEDRLAHPLGLTRTGELALGRDQNDVQIEFSAVTFTSPLRYQYLLEPLQSQWSEPSRERSAHFAHLPSGAYRFRVRAVTADGGVLPSEAVAAFRIAPAFWRTPWFAAAVLLVVGAVVYGAHRARLRRVVELARTRQQIAMDLHDDIGAGLVEVAILGELARREGAPAADAPLARVTALARSMRESMADIVWAIDPDRDSLADVVQRLRDTTFNLSDLATQQVVFNAPDEQQLANVVLEPDRRRGLLLIFKEALANAIRHGGQCRIHVDLDVREGFLDLRVRDDGEGFDPSRPTEGNGLRNLSRRADAIGATLTIDTAPGRGSTVSLRLPLASPPIWVVGLRQGRR